MKTRLPTHRRGLSHSETASLKLLSTSFIKPWKAFWTIFYFQMKASRMMIRKPYFYPLNIQAPSSSWLLMSQNYKNYQNDLKLIGLIIVTQSRGSIRITLRARPECVELCKDLTMSLYAGESLVFLSHMWTFSYQFSAGKDFTVTFITETDFNWTCWCRLHVYQRLNV